MTDYSHILPADDHEAQQLLSSCAGSHASTPFDRASIVIDDGDVRLRVRTVYGSNDGTPMNEWHGLVQVYDLPGGIDAGWLREQLGEGGNHSELLDRIIAGHNSHWDGSNYVGRLSEDARAASEELNFSLYDTPMSDMEVWDAEEWLLSDGQMNLQALAELLRQETPEEHLAAAQDGTVVIRGGLDAMRQAIASIVDRADEERTAA